MQLWVAITMLAAGLGMAACDADDPAGSGRPSPTVQTPDVQIDPALFSSQAQQEAHRLECRSGRSVVTEVDSVGRSRERASDDRDPATDGLQALALEHRTSFEIEDGKSPTPRYLFPQQPAASVQAVVQFVSPSDRVVGVFLVTRGSPRAPWRATTVLECA